MDNVNSRKRIQNAFLSLLKTEHIEKITIARIIEEAGVSRTTYYRYYYDQREILTEIVDAFIKSLSDSTSSIGIPDIFPENNLHFSLNIYMELSIYAANAELLRVLFKSDAADYLRSRVYEHYSVTYDSWMAAASNETRELCITDEDYDFYKRYSFAGHYDIIRGWIIGGCKTSIDDLVHFLVKVNSINSQFITVKQKS